MKWQGHTPNSKTRTFNRKNIVTKGPDGSNIEAEKCLHVRTLT